MARIDPARLDLLFIENVGNLICPVGFDLGQDAKVGMFAVSDGDDKAAKHPYIVVESAALVLGKMDLLPYVPFDLDLFRQDVRGLNPSVRLFELSVTSGQGMEPWLAFLREGIARKKRA
jgi:hydrogenase nickel incorporation protein HypB